MFVSFQINNALTTMGQHLHMTGNLPKLGEWDVEKTVRLTTSETKYPKWTVRKPIFVKDIEQARDIIYKYVIHHQDEHLGHHNQGKSTTIYEKPNHKNRLADASPFFDDFYFNHVIVQDCEWNGFDIKGKIKVIFGRKQNPQWKKLSKNADNRVTKYKIDGASLNLSIGEDDDLNEAQNLQKFKQELVTEPPLIIESDDDSEEQSSFEDV